MSANPAGLTIALHAEKPISAEKLKALYDSEPWWPERSVEDLQTVIDLYPAVGAWDGAALIGFARAFTDSRFRAHVEDVLVLEAYRGGGIGNSIMNVLLEALVEIDVATLFCQRRFVPYYESLGFKEFSRQVVMQKRNHR